MRGLLTREVSREQLDVFTRPILPDARDARSFRIRRYFVPADWNTVDRKPEGEQIAAV